MSKFWFLFLIFTHDGLMTTRYELKIDSGSTVVVTPRPVGSELSVALPQLDRGQHTLVLSACNATECAAAPLTFIVDTTEPHVE